MLNKIKKITKEIINIKNIVIIFCVSLLVIPFVVIFIVLNKGWANGLSTAALLYICCGILILILDIAHFDTLNKLKRIFAIKKENKEKLSEFEKMQMKLLKIEDDEKKKKNNKKIIKFVSWYSILYGTILLIISLPFIFI